MVNLLPPEQKRELLKEERYRLVILLSVLILLFLVSLSLVLLSVKIYVSGKAQEQEILLESERNEFQSSEGQTIEKDINSVNSILSQLDYFYQNQRRRVDLLEKISDNLAEEAYLDNLNLNYSPQDEETKVSLRGYFPSRELLFEFKKILEEDPSFYEIDFSPSNWINPANFYVSFKVHPVK